jgi:hypothetical protein
MRAWIVAGIVLAGAGVHSTAAAQDAEALRRELSQMKQQFEQMQQQYQKAIDQMSERIKRLEAQPPAPAPTATTPPAPRPAPAGTAAPPSGPSVSLMDLARPREPFSLYSQRGAGQLLFDIGLAGDFIGNLSQKSVQQILGGSFPGRENRFFPREVELSLFGQIDPYASAVVRLEAGEEERGQETGVGLAEAYLTLQTLPFGTQLRMGQMRNRFGYINAFHAHDRPWPDSPNVYLNFFGEEGLVEKGFEGTVVFPTPFYLEFLAGVFDGDNETAFGLGSLKNPLATGRLRTFVEPTDTQALQLGASVASGLTPERLRNTILGADLRYKYRPEGWLHPLLTLTSEALWQWRGITAADDFDGDGIADRERRNQASRWGFYAGLEVQPWRRWAGGVRYDWSQYPVAVGREWAVEPYLAFSPSEFLRFRLAYKHTDRSHRDQFNALGNFDGSGRIADEILFQATFILGAHPAHPF